jgi:hypothetical protein
MERDASFINIVQSLDDLEGCESPTPVTRFRTDLIYEDQVAAYNLHKWDIQAKYLECKAREIEVTPHHKKVAIKVLVDEAHRLHQIQQVKRSFILGNIQAVEDQELDMALTKRWQQLGQGAMREFHRSGHQHVIRNLSCMCIFVEGRQAEVYGEHEADRVRRVMQQCDALQRLHAQRLQGQSSCFLPECNPSTHTQQSAS